MRYSKELIESIERAFTFHADGHDSGFRFHGYDDTTKTFRVRLQGELLDLTRREAWILALGMAHARSAATQVDRRRLSVSTASEREIRGSAYAREVRR